MSDRYDLFFLNFCDGTLLVINKCCKDLLFGLMRNAFSTLLVVGVTQDLKPHGSLNIPVILITS